MAIVSSLCVIGTGLIGTSVGLAARRAGIERVVGVDRDRGVADAALAIGGFTELLDDVALAEVELVVVATPVTAAASILPSILSDAVVTDVVSTKRTILRLASEAGLGERFCGAHPMAGSDRSGPDAARADLFDDAPCHLCPGEASAATVERVTAFWQSLGCRTTTPMSAEAHDRLVARVSHLPHVTAVALRTLLAGDHVHGGQGMADMTRIAGGDTELWLGILSDNADEVADATEALAGALQTFARHLRDGERDDIRHALAAVQKHTAVE